MRDHGIVRFLLLRILSKWQALFMWTGRKQTNLLTQEIDPYKESPLRLGLGTFMCNVDTSFFEDSGRISFGLLVCVSGMNRSFCTC